jgi:hypothetical protein
LRYVVGVEMVGKYGGVESKKKGKGGGGGKLSRLKST